MLPVGSLEAGKSPYGIYDLAGNVWEWVADWYDAGYDQRSPVQNPTGPSEGQTKVARGGAWDRHVVNVRSASRSSFAPTNQFKDVGFRCVQDVPK